MHIPEHPVGERSDTVTTGGRSPGAMRAADFRILLIDDNVDSNESMAALLGIFDYQVQTAYDATSALVLAERFEPHLVLSDLALPGMDGYQLAQELRKSGRKMVLAAASGYGQPEHLQRSKDAGFDHHLIKPLDADYLLAFVRQQLDNLSSSSSDT